MKENKMKMWKRIGLLSMAVCLTILNMVACVPTLKSKKIKEVSYEQISQTEAKELIDNESDVIILDVRTEEEFEEVHIAGAICIPNETIDENVIEELPDKDQLILVYCRSGNRSKQASQKLVGLGYTNIKEFGGINTWKYETE